MVKRRASIMVVRGDDDILRYRRLIGERSAGVHPSAIGLWKFSSDRRKIEVLRGGDDDDGDEERPIEPSGHRNP
jgi:hypothetical protein